MSTRSKASAQLQSTTGLDADVPPERGQLSERAERVRRRSQSAYYAGWAEVERNPYHVEKNPGGCIQLGLAENKLSYDLLQERLTMIGSPYDPKTTHLAEDAPYNNYAGTQDFREVLAGFMQQALGLTMPINPDLIITSAGATPLVESVAIALADPEETLLVPAPYYPGFDSDTVLRTGVHLVPVLCSSNMPKGEASGEGQGDDTSLPFELTREALEKSLASAWVDIKGVLLSSPSNPLGRTLTQQELQAVLHFCKDHRLHLVADEIYAGSVYCEPKFVSVLTQLTSESADIQEFAKEHVHVIYGLSKDLGVPGFRAGVLYTQNKSLFTVVKAMLRFGAVSTITQRVVASLLRDRSFVTEYLTENKRRLRAIKEKLVQQLLQCGIKAVPANAGLFLWVDMRHLLMTQEWHGELGLWEALLYKAGMNVTPGSSAHCSEAGWFRFCFAAVSQQELEVAMQRLAKLVLESRSV